MRETLWGVNRPLLAALIVALLLATPGTAAAQCEFIRAPFPQPWAPHPVFPGCFFVVGGWLICLATGGVPTPDDPPGTPTFLEVVHVVCYSGDG